MLEELQQYLAEYECNDYSGGPSQWMTDELVISYCGTEYPVLKLLDKMARKIKELEIQALSPPPVDMPAEPEPYTPTPTGANDNIVVQSLIDRVNTLELRVIEGEAKVARIEDVTPASGLCELVTHVGDVDRKNVSLTASVEKIGEGTIDLFNAIIDHGKELDKLNEEIAAIKLKNGTNTKAKRIVRVKTRGIKDGIPS
ncbi:MAG: hypothetical protein KAJ73_00225 [Zetaproteobacteria bacterium]|nr:hypothetical protein [Zetaproteobacteria bacterium]